MQQDDGIDARKLQSACYIAIDQRNPEDGVWKTVSKLNLRCWSLLEALNAHRERGRPQPPVGTERNKVRVRKVSM